MVRSISRNDPCYCGSGIKFKKCCLGKDRPEASGFGATNIADELHKALKDQQFGSLAEVQAFTERYTQQGNQRPLDEFHGVSPDQMHHLLHFPLASPELIHLPEKLVNVPKAPVLTLFGLLAEAIGEQGLKPTAKGNLPQKFCRAAAATFRKEEARKDNIRCRSVNREEDFFELHVTRLLAELAGLIRKYKGRFILSRQCRSQLKNEGMYAIYPQLFKTYIEQFNWAYWDGYPELRFMQSAAFFTLYLLSLYGDTERPHTFYEDQFLRAFPMVLQEIPPDDLWEPDAQIRTCYTWRTLVHFVNFFGLATVVPVSGKYYDKDYRVKALPLLHDTVQFHV